MTELTKEQIEKTCEVLRKDSDNAYCRALDLADKNCRGAQQKLENGNFGNEDLNWHCKHNELIGFHRGICHASKTILQALDQASHERIKTDENNSDVNGWMPIESAPKDVGVIVAFDEPFFGEMIKQTAYGYYDSESKKWMFDLPMCIGEKELLRPTHWKHKETPPTEKGA